MELKNKVVLITGSSSGIGQATAKRFAQEGATIVIHYHENENGAKETQEEVKKLNVESIIVKSDLSVEKDIKKFV